MNTADIISIITATTSLIAAVGAAVATVFAAKAKALAEESRDGIQKVSVQTDGLKDALVASTAKASHAEGKLEGAAEEKFKINT